MRIEPRRAIVGLVIAGVAGSFLLLPALSLVGTLLAPSMPAPHQSRVVPLLGEAIWARSLGGRAAALQPINPFTVARAVSCHLLAERFDDQAERDREHDGCMELLPGIQGIGHLANIHMQSEGVWEDPRVPFVALATVSKVSSTWTKAELLDSLAARGEFGNGLIGADHAARAYFGKTPGELALAEIALLASALGNRRLNPWCRPEEAARARLRILSRMRDSQVIDDPAVDAANRMPLGILPTPPPRHQPCRN